MPPPWLLSTTTVSGACVSALLASPTQLTVSAVAQTSVSALHEVPNRGGIKPPIGPRTLVAGRPAQAAARPRLRLCAEWLHRTTWRVSPLRAWVRGQQGKRGKEGREAEVYRAGVERVFSAAGRMHDDLRKSVSNETLEHSLFAAFNSPDGRAHAGGRAQGGAPRHPGPTPAGSRA